MWESASVPPLNAALFPGQRHRGTSPPERRRDKSFRRQHSTRHREGGHGATLAESFAQGGVLRFEFGVPQAQRLDVVGVGGDSGACLPLLGRMLGAPAAPASVGRPHPVRGSGDRRPGPPCPTLRYPLQYRCQVRACRPPGQGVAPDPLTGRHRPRHLTAVDVDYHDLVEPRPTPRGRPKCLAQSPPHGPESVAQSRSPAMKSPTAPSTMPKTITLPANSGAVGANTSSSLPWTDVVASISPA